MTQANRVHSTPPINTSPDSPTNAAEVHNSDADGAPLNLITQVLEAWDHADEATQNAAIDFLRAAAQMREVSLKIAGRSTGTPASAPPARDRLTCTIELSKLRSLDMDDLQSLSDVLHATSEILRAFKCQPRFKGPSDFSYNAAGDLLEDIIEWIDCCETAVVDIAKAATPDTARDAELRGWTVIGFHADMMDDLSNFAVMASKAASDEAKTKRRENQACLRGGE